MTAILPEASTTPHFRWPLRVYYEDTDAAGVVYYANYLRYMERARSEWLLSLGHAIGTDAAGGGTAFVVRRTRIDFLRPARLAEAIEATLCVAGLSRVELQLDQAVRRAEQVLVEARVELACVDMRSWRPVRIPAPLMRTLEAFR